MTTQGHLWPEHPVVPRLSRGHTADVSASSEWRHNRDVPAMSLGRPPDARETSRPRPSGVTAGDVPETSSAGGHRLSDGCGTSPRRPSPADAPGTSPTVQRRAQLCAAGHAPACWTHSGLNFQDTHQEHYGEHTPESSSCTYTSVRIFSLPPCNTISLIGKAHELLQPSPSCSHPSTLAAVGLLSLAECHAASPPTSPQEYRLQTSQNVYTPKLLTINRAGLCMCT